MAINKKSVLRKLMTSKEADRVSATVALAMARKRVVDVTMLWGVGTRNCVGIWEESALKHLGRLDSAVKKSWALGLGFTIIFADIHAGLNNIPHDIVKQYLESLRCLLTATPFDVKLVLLSSLWGEAGFQIEDVLSCARLTEKSTKSYNFPRLVESARKRFHGGDPEKGARDYLAAREVDNKVITSFYPQAIHATYNDPESMKWLQPSGVPVIYLWSIKKGRSMPPWFFNNMEI
jgi:hypothetical protein